MNNKKSFFKVAKPYVPILRQLLMTHEYEVDEIPFYLRDIYTKSYVVGKRGSIPITKVTSDELCIPTFDICNKTMMYKEDFAKFASMFKDKNPWNHIDNRINDSLDRQEDSEGFKVINSGAPMDQTISVQERLHPESLSLAIKLVESHELTVRNITMHSFRFEDIKEHFAENPSNIFSLYPKYAPEVVEYTDLDLSEFNYYKHHNFNNLYQAGVRAFYKGIPIWVSSVIPKNASYVLAEKEYVGVLVRKPGFDRNEHVTEDNDTGKIMTRHNGYATINDYAISKIIVS